MSKKFDRFIKDFFQKPYDVIKSVKVPSFVLKVTNLIGSYIKIPALGDIIKVAHEISKEVDTEKVPGWIKKRKVVAGITKFAKSFGYNIPKVAANFINELVAIYIKLISKKS